MKNLNAQLLCCSIFGRFQRHISPKQEKIEAYRDRCHVKKSPHDFKLYSIV